MKRPIESDYTSHVAYTRALEQYCDTLAQPEKETVEDVVAYHSDGTMTVRISPKRKPLVWLTWDDIPEADVGNQDFRRGAMWAVDFFKEKNT